MKKNYLFMGVAVLLILASPVRSQAKTGSEKKSTTVTSSSIPDDLKKIFENSCMGCHSNDGRKMAMAKLNFSVWDNYEPDKQAKKAARICKKITKGSMPPKSFRKSNPDAIPTSSQIDVICKWSKTFAQKK